jgi:hypothetical protein
MLLNTGVLYNFSFITFLNNAHPNLQKFKGSYFWLQQVYQRSDEIEAHSGFIYKCANFMPFGLSGLSLSL